MTDKITLSPLANLNNGTSATTAINSNFSTIQSAFDNTLSRDGTAPNQMDATLDMNSNRVLNLIAPSTTSEPLRLGDVSPVVVPAVKAELAPVASSGLYSDLTGRPVISDVGHTGQYTDVIGTPPVFTGSVPGLVPTSIGGTSNYLRADGSWVPSGSAATTFLGATNGADGTAGGVPQPLAGQQHRYLRADSTWDVPTASELTGFAAVATSASATDLTTGTLPAARLPNPAPTTLGGVKSAVAISHQFVTQIGTDGSITQAQPSASDVSGLAAVATSGSATDLTIGTLPAGRLPNPSSSTLGGVKSAVAVSHQFLTQIGTDGSISQAQPAFTDISGSVAATQLPNPSASTLGGVKSLASASHQFLTQIGTDGSVSQAQPAFTDVSGSVAASQMPALTGDVTTSAGAVATTIAANAVSNAKLATAANLTVKSNVSGGTTTPSDNTVTAILDAVFTNARGSILFRGNSAWQALAPGTAGYVLQTGGAGVDPLWVVTTGGGGGGTGGIASINFGSWPGSSSATVTITGQTTILTTSKINVSLSPVATADHTIEEHVVDAPYVMGGNIVAGTGFTVYAQASFGNLFGVYNVAWSYVV